MSDFKLCTFFYSLGMLNFLLAAHTQLSATTQQCHLWLQTTEHTAAPGDPVATGTEPVSTGDPIANGTELISTGDHMASGTESIAGYPIATDSVADGTGHDTSSAVIRGILIAVQKVMVRHRKSVEENKHEQGMYLYTYIVFDGVYDTKLAISFAVIILIACVDIIP